MSMTDTTTAAPAAPATSDPNGGELGPAIERSAPRPSAPAPAPKSFERTRFEQDQKAARAPGDAKASGEAPAPAAEPQQPPPVAKIKIGRFETTEDEFNQMATRIAADDVRKGSLPQTPEAYKAELPADFKPPAGVEFKLDTANPALGQLKQVAHKHGLTQDAVNELIGVYAGNEVGTEARIKAAATAEVAKLGASGTARVDAVTRFMDGSGLGVLKSTLVTAAQIEAWESHINKLTSQGSAPFSQQHRVAPETNSIPGYEGMSFEQRRFAQDQIAARRGR